MIASLNFQKVHITVSEQYSTEYFKIIRGNKAQKEKRKELVKDDIFELVLDQLNVKYEQGKHTDVKVSIYRLYAEDVQIEEVSIPSNL